MPLTPNNREEHWLQGMVDGSTDLTPNNRREHWYKEIIDNGSGGGGGGGGALIVHDTEGTLDKTFAEIKSVIMSGTPVYILYNEATDGKEVTDLTPIITCIENEDGHICYAPVIILYNGSETIEFRPYWAETVNDYPTLD